MLRNSSTWDRWYEKRVFEAFPVHLMGIWESYHERSRRRTRRPADCMWCKNLQVRAGRGALVLTASARTVWSYLRNYLSNLRVPFQIVRDEDTQTFVTLNNFNVLTIDEDRWKWTLWSSKTNLQLFALASFSWNRSAWAAWTKLSTVVWIWLQSPLWVVSLMVVSPTYLHRSTASTWRSLIITTKSQGPSLVPCGTPAWTLPSLWEAVLRELDSLVPISGDIFNPETNPLRHVKVLKLLQ